MKRLLFILMILAVSLTGCQREQFVGNEDIVPLTQLKSVKVDLQGTSDNPETKSVIGYEVEGFRCAYLFAFVANPGANKGKVYTYLDGMTVKPVAVYTEAKSFDWDLPVGEVAGVEQHMDIWALVNPPASLVSTLEGFLENASLKESDLSALMYVCDDVTDMLEMEDDGMPMSGMMNDIYLETADDPLAFTLKRLYAKYYLKLNVSALLAKGWNVLATNVVAAQTNTEVPYFYTGSGVGFRQTNPAKIKSVDFAQDWEMDEFNAFGSNSAHTSESSVSIYLLENCQGDLGPASSWNTVNLLGDEVANCSYIKISVLATRGDYLRREFNYRLYPGSQNDMKSNFDIIRNKRRNITISIDSPSDGFTFTNSSTPYLEIGETAVIPYETTLKEDEFTIESQNPSDIEIIDRTFYDTPNPNPKTSYPNWGTATVKAKTAATAGLKHIVGHDLSNEISDRAGVEVDIPVEYEKKEINVYFRPVVCIDPYDGYMEAGEYIVNVYVGFYASSDTGDGKGAYNMGVFENIPCDLTFTWTKTSYPTTVTFSLPVGYDATSRFMHDGHADPGPFSWMTHYVNATTGLSVSPSYIETESRRINFLIDPNWDWCDIDEFESQEFNEYLNETTSNSVAYILDLRPAVNYTHMNFSAYDRECTTYYSFGLSTISEDPDYYFIYDGKTGFVSTPSGSFPVEEVIDYIKLQVKNASYRQGDGYVYFHPTPSHSVGKLWFVNDALGGGDRITGPSECTTKNNYIYDRHGYYGRYNAFDFSSDDLSGLKPSVDVTTLNEFPFKIVGFAFKSEFAPTVTHTKSGKILETASLFYPL